MRETEHHLDIKKLSFAGLIITLGVVYGDLGTSPLYTMRAILLAGKANINELLIYGSLSCIFWTLTLQTTIKYILITLRADNNGEGGIFALFALIRKKSGWAAILTMAGGAALLADGVITPSITVTSAIEGLRLFNTRYSGNSNCSDHFRCIVFYSAIWYQFCRRIFWSDNGCLVFDVRDLWIFTTYSLSRHIQSA